MQIRGIVIGMKMDNSALQFRGGVDLEDLLKWLLYWDKITYAGVTIQGASISGNHPPDIEYLQQEGVFRTELVDITTLNVQGLPEPQPGIKIFGIAGNQFQIVNSAARLQLVENLSKSNEIWTVGQSATESLVLPGTQNVELIDVCLYNSLPVPRPGTSFEDILYFKSKYASELEALRIYLDELRQSILGSVDEERAIKNSLSRINLALADIDKALKSSAISTFTDTISLITENPSVGFWTAIGGGIASTRGIPIEFGAAAGGGLATMFQFFKRLTKGGDNIPNPNVEFTYLRKVKEKLK